MNFAQSQNQTDEKDTMLYVRPFASHTFHSGEIIIIQNDKVIKQDS